MRSVSITLLLALGSAMTVACGGGGAADSTAPHPNDGYDTPPSTYQSADGETTPPSTEDTPPSSDEPAPTDYTPPPSGDGGGICSDLCKVALNLDCLSASSELSGLTQGQCEQSCAPHATELEAEACVTEDLKLLGCLLNDAAGNGLSCELFDASENGNLTPDQEQQLQDLVQNHCRGEYDAFAKCEGITAMPPGQQCDAASGSCGGCTDACSRCACDGDRKACTDCANN